VLEAFRRNFPQSPLHPDVTRKLAVAYSESNHPGPAAAEFEPHRRAPGETPACQREATLRATELYDKAGDSASQGVLEASSNSFPS